jgi:hypothetical protein
LIIACSRHHGAELEQRDSDFDRILAALEEN